MSAPTEHVLQFIADFGAAWAKCSGVLDRDPLRALDEWDAAVGVLRSRYFVADAVWNANEELSRVGADHEAEREVVVREGTNGDAARVITRTSSGAAYFASVAARAAGALHYDYRLVGGADGWRIVSVEAVVAEPV